MIRGKKHWLWRAVDCTGEVLDILLQTRRNAGNTAFHRKVGRSFPARLRWRRPLAKANVFALELKSRPRRGAICRQEPGGCDGSWPLSAFSTVGTTLGCFHTKRLRPARPTNPPSRALCKYVDRQRNIAQAQGKPVIRPNGIGNDGLREPEAFQARL